MKAIQIRYLGATDTKCARLKAWTEAGSMIESRNFEFVPEFQAARLALKYMESKGWGQKVSGFGTLPNGDFVVTIGK